MKKIFAINAGSSSLKFQLLAMPDEEIIAKGIFERIGEPESAFTLVYQGQKETEKLVLSSYKEAVNYLLKKLDEKGIIQSLADIAGVGHRVAHGGDYFKSSALVDQDVINKIDDLSFLAPSHNPANLEVIKAFKELLPNTPNVAVFDTAFHQTLSEEYYLYPLPRKYYDKYRLRKYGFHGTSHKYISLITKEVYKQQGLDTDQLKVISCHLGNGASICAMKGQTSINTSMGFTPLAGLMMGSRSGDIDPAILPFLMEEEGLTPDQINTILNKESGLLAVSEISNDLRDIEEAYHNGNPQAKTAIEMFTNRIAHTIATYIVDLAGVDAIVFTAGIGENSKLIREKVAGKLLAFGVKLDKESNHSGKMVISQEQSSIKLFVLPTNEELMIARDTLELI
ncbi:acetate/propionate family kinase [Streptococcus suis]|uniref:acetate/propionate family kinase n=1 Tax=Streptococcus suis TaxID=1307 RepID=UPI000CF52F28|nr:acetate kinase [Streptococcus suis]HEM6221277.1 acetate kinase [Streptococcus suis]HEM6302354.1 acetate kinase [Streptococcus suis]